MKRASIVLTWLLACIAIDLLFLGILLESQRPHSVPLLGLALALVASVGLLWAFITVVRPHVKDPISACFGSVFLGCLGLALLADTVIF